MSRAVGTLAGRTVVVGPNDWSLTAIAEHRSRHGFPRPSAGPSVPAARRQQGRPRRVDSRTTCPPPRGGASSEDERAIARYRYLLRTAPPEDIEKVHAEAFAKLSPEQRQMVLQRLTEDLPESERPRTDQPADLARSATRAEMRQPGYLQGAFGGGRGGMGHGRADVRRIDARDDCRLRRRARPSPTSCSVATSPRPRRPTPVTPVRRGSATRGGGDAGGDAGGGRCRRCRRRRCRLPVAALGDFGGGDFGGLRRRLTKPPGSRPGPHPDTPAYRLLGRLQHG